MLLEPQKDHAHDDDEGEGKLITAEMSISLTSWNASRLKQFYLIWILFDFYDGEILDWASECVN